MAHKYSSLAELKAAYDSEKLSEDSPLYLDNDHVTVYNAASNPIFESHPADLLEEALDLLGIPWSSV